MDKTLCEHFDTLRNYLRDDLENYASVDFNQNKDIKYYCSSGESGKTECKTDLDKINAGCLWLFEQLFLKNKKNTNTVQYIIIWLSYKLNQKTYDEAKDLNDFYKKCIENNRHYTSCNNDSGDCSKQLEENTGYNNYKEIINGRMNLLSTNIKNMPKIYDAFKLLCNIYTELGGSNTQNNKYLENASEFVKKYNELNNVSDNTKDDAYYQVLTTLSNDYINLKYYCDNNRIDCSSIPSLIPTETDESGVQSSGKSCNVTSPSLSIVNKLILALSIFSVITIFLGIFFKVNNKKFKNYFH
ncbi:putative yir1 protein [Plasmodium yoelii yoelii]|uniref:Yir1 protein n=1 Tax=Plasmodium yoelii yoelii TaxID=73239 RepID=Q7RGL2_PLAYO|nr:putative yir1 protein [Plasmodium yoelii yoelii]